MRDAVGGAVDAHGPVLGVVAALVQHRYQLSRPHAALYVPRDRVATAQHLVLQYVQSCTRELSDPTALPCRHAG